MGKKQIIIILVLISVLFIVFIGTGFAISLTFLPKQSDWQEPVIFHIEKGQSLKEISQNLENNGLIYWGPSFRIYAILSGSAKKIQAGTYLFSASESVPQIVEDFVQGRTAKTRITIPEGFTANDIYEKLKDVTSVTREELLASEGYLFPDTYEIFYGASGQDVVEIMEDNFYKKVGPDLRDEIARQGKTLKDIVIMASLLEKEVKGKEDKEIVSGIFWKRIESGKPLESCATIAYIKGVNQWLYSFNDTRIESPYNTYLNRGLPIGPICNPGLESIEAASFPKESDYWYYLSTPEGKTIFSRTFAEHSAAKAKYLK